MLASICMITWGRPRVAKETIAQIMGSAGLDKDQYELLICDQGTVDADFIDYLKDLDTGYLRLNKFNEGLPRSLNQLILRAKGKHIFW